jgi:hypothetical protein
MSGDGIADVTNVVRFPGELREPPSLALVARLAPSQSLVDTLITERGDVPRDTQSAFAREFMHQVRTLAYAVGCDEAVLRVRGLVDAHVAHAVTVCREYQRAADRMVRLEVEVAQADRPPVTLRSALETLRREMRGHVIAARVAADAALGAASALAVYISDGASGLPVSVSEPRQLLLFAAGGG